MTPIGTTPLSPTFRELREAYLADFRNACRDDQRTKLEALIWARLHDFAGPPIDHLHNEPPLAVLAWVLTSLDPKQAKVVGEVAFDVFTNKLRDAQGRQPPSRTVGAVSDLAELLELSRQRIGVTPERMEAALDELLANNLALARSLYESKTESGEHLLSDVLRALAFFTSERMAERWRRLLTAPELEHSALPAFMGYARSVGPNARDGLPFVARALANRKRPDTLAVVLKSFAVAGYLDVPSKTVANALVVGDFVTLFTKLPPTIERRTFIQDTFKYLGQLEHVPAGLLSEWETAARIESPEEWFRQLLSDDIGPLAVPTFTALLWALGRDARVALPLVARALRPQDRGEQLADMLVSVYNSDDPDHPKRLKRDYRRRPLDVGDFYALFSLVPPAEQSPAIEATFQFLRARGLWLTELPAWEAAARAGVKGVLADAIDSPLFAKFPVLHAHLAPAFVQTHPGRQLDSLYIKSEPYRVMAPPPAQLVMVLAPADRFLYAPGPTLTSHRDRVKEAERSIRFRFVSPSDDGTLELASEAKDVLTRALAPDEEEALLTLILSSKDAEKKCDDIAARLLSFYKRPNPVPPELPPEAASRVTVKFQQPAPVVSLAGKTYPSSRSYQPVPNQEFNPQTLLAWLRANLTRLLGIQQEAPENLYRSPEGLSICCGAAV